VKLPVTTGGEFGARGFVRIDGRTVHYRRFGTGPAALVLHGSPQASRAVTPIARAIAARGLCAIAPDTPGAGLSTPLPLDAPESEDYARALAGLCDALGLKRVGLYGFHTGAATACAFAALFPERAAAVALDGLPAWTRDERADLIARYLPPFEPVWDGSHMAWAWARMEEQVVFFPWHQPGSDTRLPFPVSPPEAVHANCMDLFDAGDAYRNVYRAAFAFRSERFLPRLVAPALICTGAVDVLRPHLDRPPLAGRPDVRDFASLDALWSGVADHLAKHPGDDAPAAPPCPPDARGLSSGFVSDGAAALRWRGRPDGGGRPLVLLHGAGGRLDDNESRLADLAGIRPVLALDLPGHGESGEGRDAPVDALDGFADRIERALTALGLDAPAVAGEGLGAQVAAELLHRGRGSAALAIGDAARTPPGSEDDVTRAAPSLAPEWDGAHLVRAWRIARWERLYDPWFDRVPAAARRPWGDLAPASVQSRAVSLLKAGPAWLAAVRAEARAARSAQISAPSRAAGTDDAAILSRL
jgi:pimeloyl-ACP methyl ester carboxylesterase